MKHNENKVVNLQGIELFTQKWEVEQPKAMILLIHGMGEHSTRYEHVAEFFAKHHIGMYTYDHVGHGKSSGKRGHVDNYEFLLDDISAMLEKLKSDYPDVPVFIYGHSMGGNLVLNYGLRKKPDVKGLIVSGPWLKLTIKVPQIRLKVGKIMSKIYPKYTEKSNLDGYNVTRDKVIAEAYNNDPLVHGYISTRFFFGVHDAGLWALENAANLKTPTYLMHGQDDKATSFEASKQFAEKAGNIVTFKPYPKMYHELHNEPERAEVLKGVLNWMEEKL